MAFTVGNAAMHAIVEQEAVPFPIATFLDPFDPALIDANPWLVPEHLDLDAGVALLSHHAWLVDVGGYKVLIDPCVGNARDRVIPAYHQLDTPWLDRLAAAGASPEQIDFVLCTHLHVDHCGWNTRLVDGRYVPTFPNARYIFTRAERDFWAQDLTGTLPRGNGFNRGIYAECVQPVIDAGLAWVVEGDERFAGAFTLIPSPGHTVGHVAALLDGGGDSALFPGDVLHSPIQLLDPRVNTTGSHDAAQGIASRRALLTLAAERRLIVAPGHFRGTNGCRVHAQGDGFTPEWVAPD